MSLHRQFMNTKITEINNNYYETWGYIIKQVVLTLIFNP